MPRLAMAHGISYVADRDGRRTCTIWRTKVEHGTQLHGAAYLDILVPCPLGWGSGLVRHDQGRSSLQETVSFPVFEAENGVVTGRLKDPSSHERPNRISDQKRFAISSAGSGRPNIVARIQAMADQKISPLSDSWPKTRPPK